ncbi:MAG TPA: protein kinase, partial [Kofleriaceae bacterium]|nr:protein kinase [Kofleriaceae bacterium]
MEALRERFGKYHVLEKIAQGGMAEVYKVKTVGIAGFEKIQALKRILPHQAREARFIRSFIDEARIAVELTHRNIVQVFDFGKADGELFLAMELIEGKDLRTVMTDAVARDALPEVSIAAYVISEVASGLDYAHRKADGYGSPLGIVHCDVSPSNVMLSSEGDIKILDFGIARATFASALERRRLRGKPRYMSPEQTTGETPTAASDVFALGIIAWELFTGEPLYRGSDLRAVLDAVRRTDPPRIDRLNPRVPEEIADAVATALRRDPEARGSAADLVNACARAAMPASPRVLARWLKDLAARPARAAAPWHVEGTMAGVREPGVAARDGLVPPRPSATVSLHDVPPPLAQTPAARPARVEPVAAEPARPTRPGGIERTEPIELIEPGPGLLAPTAPSERPERTERLDRVDPDDLGDRPMWLERRSRPEVPAREPSAITTLPAASGFEPDASTTQSRRFEPGTRQDATATAQQPFDPVPLTTQVSAPPGRWQPEATVAGHARLADVLPPETVADGFAGSPETTPFLRRSYERLEVAPGVAPSALRFDDDATHYGFALPGVHDTSYDELDVEPDLPAPAAPPSPAFGDAPIDDDLGEVAGSALAERRRIVLVAGLVSGAPPDALRPVTKSLGELAYQRGGVVLEFEPAALIVAFGLEIAGEDDVAIAMGWALDAAAMARDAAADGDPVQVRIGARAGVATSGAHAAAPTATPRGFPRANEARGPFPALDLSPAVAVARVQDAAP